ncbi:MAG: SPASM domain-containing protein [Thermonemataceae bacterium]|nr:SPASM domain-containing protein [Thermonemataceae bacterium]
MLTSFVKKTFRKSLAYQQKIDHIRLEASAKCQLKCPLCLTGTHYHRKYSAIGWGNLSLAQLKKIIDKNPQIKSIELSNYGELFLNPAIEAIIAFAKKKQIKLTALNGTNLNHLPDKVAEALVKYQFEKIKVSIDGASQESYQIYRIGGDFEKVIANIKKINFYKEKYQSKYPKLKWQFIVFGHNEHEIRQAKLLAENLKMGFKPKINYDARYSPIKHIDVVAQELHIDAALLEKYNAKKQEVYTPACLQLWTAPQINWDGKLLGCCVNHFGDFGNVFEQGLSKLLQSEKYLYAKKMLLGEQAPRSDIPCSQCKRFKEILHINFKDILKQHLASKTK